MDKIIEKNPKIKQRLLQFIGNKQITKVGFCEMTGISYSNIKGKASKSELGGDQISRILEVFDDLSPDWFLLGRGPMLRNGQIFNGNNFVNSGNVTNSHIDQRNIHSDSPDVLRAQVDQLDERIKEKDAQIKEKDAQIKEKDAQIKDLLTAVVELTRKVNC